MGKNDTLFLIIGGFGLLYFYNKNPDFKSKVDGFINSLKGQTAAATTDSGTTDTGTTDTSGTSTGVTPSTTYILGDLSSTNAEDCQAAYGGSCTQECATNGLSSEECLQCKISCAGVKPKKSKTKKHATAAADDKEPAGHTTPAKGHYVPKIAKCSTSCDFLRSASPATYDTCCKQHAMYARRAYYSLGSLYAPAQNCRPSCYAWKDLNPSVYLSCCQNRTR